MQEAQVIDVYRVRAIFCEDLGGMLDQVAPLGKSSRTRQGADWRAILARIQNFTSEVFEDLAPTTNDPRNCQKWPTKMTN